MQTQDCSSQARKKVWLGLVLALVVGQGLLLPSHQCLSIIEILRVYLHIPCIKQAEMSYYSDASQGTERDA